MERKRPSAEASDTAAGEAATSGPSTTVDSPAVPAAGAAAAGGGAGSAAPSAAAPTSRSAAGLIQAFEALERLHEQAVKLGHPDIVERALRHRDAAHQRVIKALERDAKKEEGGDDADKEQFAKGSFGPKERARLEAARAAYAATRAKLGLAVPETGGQVTSLAMFRRRQSVSPPRPTTHAAASTAGAEREPGDATPATPGAEHARQRRASFTPSDSSHGRSSAAATAAAAAAAGSRAGVGGSPFGGGSFGGGGAGGGGAGGGVSDLAGGPSVLQLAGALAPQVGGLAPSVGGGLDSAHADPSATGPQYISCSGSLGELSGSTPWSAAPAAPLKSCGFSDLGSGSTRGGVSGPAPQPAPVLSGAMDGVGSSSGALPTNTLLQPSSSNGSGPEPTAAGTGSSFGPSARQASFSKASSAALSRKQPDKPKKMSKAEQVGQLGGAGPCLLSRAPSLSSDPTSAHAGERGRTMAGDPARAPCSLRNAPPRHLMMSTV